MADIALFILGATITSIIVSAIGLLIWAAVEDGRAQTNSQR